MGYEAIKEFDVYEFYQWKYEVKNSIFTIILLDNKVIIINV